MHICGFSQGSQSSLCNYQLYNYLILPNVKIDKKDPQSHRWDSSQASQSSLLLRSFTTYFCSFSIFAANKRKDELTGFAPCRYIYRKLPVKWEGEVD